MLGLAVTVVLWMAAVMPAVPQSSCRQLDDERGNMLYPVLSFSCEGEDMNCSCRLPYANSDCRETLCGSSGQVPWPCGKLRCFKYRVEQLQRPPENCLECLENNNSSCRDIVIRVSNNCSSTNFSDAAKTTFIFFLDAASGFQTNNSSLGQNLINTNSSVFVYKMADDVMDSRNRTIRELERGLPCQEQLQNVSNIISTNESVIQYNIIEDSEYLVICTKVSRFKSRRRTIWDKVPITPLVLMFFGVSISLISLLLTAIVTSVLGEHRSVPGLNLLCLATSLFVAYSCVPVGVLYGIWRKEAICRMAGLLHVYSLLSTIFWLNVMAFDIWRSLSAMEPVGRYTSREYKWIVFSYCTYAWGTPALLVLTGYLLDNSHSVSPDYQPHFAFNCWFQDEITKGTVLLYHIPISLILIGNIIFFLCTARIFWVARKAQTTTMTVHDSNCRYNLGLYIKLFLVMGLTWILESMAMSIHPDVFRTICDFINTLQGLFIFLIFCCKRRVLERIKQRLRGGRGRTGSSLTSTPSTILRYQGSVRSDISVRLNIPNGNVVTRTDNPQIKAQFRPTEL